MTETKLLIAADDLTGGLDTGVQFGRQGISVRVIVDPDREGNWLRTQAQVLVAVSETRHMTPEAAYETVYRTVSAARRAGVPYIYKKTDSALRGNIGAELSAALKAGGEDTLSFLPAYPAMNRVTKDGYHYIDGVPVAQSLFGKDPFNPVKESDVRKLIRSQTDTPVIGEGEAGKGILIVNAQTDEDLKAAGMRLLQRGCLSVSAGCAGFAAFLPDLLGLKKREAPVTPDPGDGLLVLSGSLNPVTVRQLDVAEKSGFKRIMLKPDLKDGEDAVTVRLPKEKRIILDSSEIDPEEESFRDYMRKRGCDSEEVRIRVAAYLAEVFAEIEDTYEGTVMIIGGDTLLACLMRLKCDGLEPLAELYPGVVLSKYRTGGREKLLISKSGGFGSETLLLDICK